MSAPERCITCADEGIVMRVLAVTGESAVCRSPAGGERVEVAVELVAPVDAGELVLVHAGVAIARVAP